MGRFAAIVFPQEGATSPATWPSARYRAIRLGQADASCSQRARRPHEIRSGSRAPVHHYAQARDSP